METPLQTILDAGPPLSLGGWALDVAALKMVLELVEAAGPGATVVECGSGESTVAIGRLLDRTGSGRLRSLEHDTEWATATRRRIEAENLSDRVEVICAPLEPHELGVDGCRWYASEAVDRLGGPIDVLLVDGPPAGEPPRERSRYPALPALAGRLAPGAVVILDDANREGERWVLGRWESEHPLDFDIRPEAGVAIGVCSAVQRDRSGKDESTS